MLQMDITVVIVVA